MSETAGWHAYALFTDAALEHMGIPLDAAHVQTENYEHLGEVRTHSFNLQERYRALTEARRVFLDEKDADFTFVRKISAPPTIVWTWANDPNKRKRVPPRPCTGGPATDPRDAQASARAITARMAKASPPRPSSIGVRSTTSRPNHRAPA